MAAVELKRLGLAVSTVEELSKSTYAARLAALYASGKEVALIKPLVAKAEALAMPYIETYTAPEFVSSCDEALDGFIIKKTAQLDGYVAKATELYAEKVAPKVAPVAEKALVLKGKGLELVSKVPKSSDELAKLREQWFAAMEAGIAELKEKSSKVPAATLEFLKEKMEAARAAVPADREAALALVGSAWEKFVAYPSVSAALEKTKVHVEAAKVKVFDLVDTVKASSVYTERIEPVVSKYAPGLAEKFLPAPAPEPEPASSD